MVSEFAVVKNLHEAEEEGVDGLQESPSHLGGYPEDWRPKPLSELSAFITKGATPTTYGFAWVSTGIPFLRSECVSESGLDMREAMFISTDAHAAIKRSEVRDGDLLITITGNVGRVILLEEFGEGNINQHIARVRITSDEAFPRYVFHFLNRPQLRTHYESITTGQAYPQISLKQVRDTSIPLPRKSEQKAIALALSDQDELIRNMERLIEKKRAVKKGAMQELITGKRRLPGFSDEWVEQSLASVVDIRSGGTPSTSNPDYWSGDVNWCTPTDITALKGYKYLETTERTITVAGLAASSAEIIPPNSIIMTSRATIGECAINTMAVTTNQGFKNLVPLKGTDAEFLYYYMLTQKDQLISLCGGSTFLEIGKSQLAQFGVRVPSSEDEQRAIASVISDMDQDIAVSLKELAKAKSIKEGMMQSLLTGKVRLV